MSSLSVDVKVHPNRLCKELQSQEVVLLSTGLQIYKYVHRFKFWSCNFYDLSVDKSKSIDVKVRPSVYVSDVEKWSRDILSSLRLTNQNVNPTTLDVNRCPCYQGVAWKYYLS